MMEWEEQHDDEEQHNGAIGDGNFSNNSNSVGGGMIYVKVMTDEQMEILRNQIAVYSTICDQLVQMHKSFSAQQDLTGVRLGNMYCDSFITASGHKLNARQRWTPSPMQLQILERIFDKGNNGTPSKQKIKEITSELSLHGPLSETNVYNWFQNRRARSKRKQSVAAPNNAESEADTEVESPKDNKTKPETFQSEQNLNSRADELCFQSSDLHSLEPHANEAETIFPSDDGLRSSRSLNQLSFYESVLSNPSMYSL